MPLRTSFLLVLGLWLAGASHAQPQERERALREWGRTVGTLGYVYGAPLLELSIAEYRQTLGLSRELSGPRGVFAHAGGGRLPTHESSSPPLPDPDVLSSSAWLDLGAEPYVLWIPPMDGHWYSVQFHDGFTNVVGSISSRTAGSVGGWYLVAQEGFEGELPPTLMGEIRIPTATTWLLLRIAATKQNEAELHARYQARFKLLPFSAYARNPTAAEHAPAAPQSGAGRPQRATAEMRGRLDAFRVINHQLRGLEPPAGEQALLALFDRAGFGPNVEFDPARLPAPLLEGLRHAAREAQRTIDDAGFEPSATQNGWRSAPAALGRYGDDYLLRAVTAHTALGIEIPAEVLYARTDVDGDGRQLDGRNNYRIRFAPDQQPPAKAFWAVAAYASASGLLMNTATSRYSVGSLGDGVQSAADASLTLWLSSDPPEDPAERANWLPVRLEPFFLVARFYEPTPAALDGRYAMPPVVSADE